MQDLLAVFLGGGIGSVLRYSISLWLGKSATGFPLGTFVANILSCIVLGIGYIYFTRYFSWDSNWRLLVLVGFCGGFSTFSTFSFETQELISQGQLGMAILYVAASVVSCVLILWGIQQLSS